MTEAFGTTKKGEKCQLFRLRNQKGMEAHITDYGATVVRLYVPDREGNLVDVVLGYEDAAGYEKGTISFGGLVGRVANRIGKARFELNGKEYRLTENVPGNTLHSGKDFYNQRKWKTLEAGEDHVVFELYSPDGDQGFPGGVTIRVTYTLTEAGELAIHYEARPEADTLLNVTNHSYFNLGGHDSGSVEEQWVQILADGFTVTDEDSIPTGEIRAVEGTPMDFRKGKRIGEEIGADDPVLVMARGYDHNFVLNGTGLRTVARMYAEKTGVAMEVDTDLPGVQFYTANYIEAEPGKEGKVYGKRSGACFETQYFPDAVNHPEFATPLVKKGQLWESRTIYRFSQGMFREA